MPHLKMNECHCIILKNIKTLHFKTNDAELICFLFCQLTAHSNMILSSFTHPHNFFSSSESKRRNLEECSLLFFSAQLHLRTAKNGHK